MFRTYPLNVILYKTPTQPVFCPAIYLIKLKHTPGHNQRFKSSAGRDSCAFYNRTPKVLNGLTETSLNLDWAALTHISRSACNVRCV